MAKIFHAQTDPGCGIQETCRSSGIDYRSIGAFWSMLFLGLLLCAGCDSNEPDDEPMDITSVAGEWEGFVRTTIGEDTVDVPVRMELSENMRALTGSGTVDLPSGPSNFGIDETSSYFHPLVNMFLIFDRPPPGTLNGIVAEDRQSISGTMAGPGFSGPAEFTMVKVE